MKETGRNFKMGECDAAKFEDTTTIRAMDPPFVHPGSIDGDGRALVPQSMRNRLLSIHHDSSNFLKETIDFFHKRASIETNIDHSKELSEAAKQRWPVVANERCGSVSDSRKRRILTITAA